MTAGGREKAQTARLVSVALGLLAIAFAARTAVVIGQEWREPNYAMPIWVVAIASFCGALTLVGAGAASRGGRGLRAWLTVLTAELLLWGLLTIFSVGLGLLLAGIACLVVRLRLSVHRPLVRRHLVVGAGILLSVGLIPLSALSISGPVVECLPGGVESSVPVWTLFGSGGGSSPMTSSGTSVSSQQSAGHVTIGATTYGYTCTKGRLTSFQPG